MCGIYGYLSIGNAPHPGPDLLARMGQTIFHRGPDDEGAYSDDKMLLGMRRLSIIDVAGGHQPLTNEDETVWAVCNGEIYNFRELRSDLLAGGHTFKTSSDTEVIPHLYEEDGTALVERLDGMYGFAIWDTRRQRLTVGRDRIGIKPIYYHVDGVRLVFASEAKAILQVPGIPTELDPTALEEYLTLGYVSAPKTLFRGIKKLPPASLLIHESGCLRIETYWYAPTDTLIDRIEADWVEAVRARLEEAVSAQMVSDVPMGAFLSGGLDSSSVVAMMAKHSDRPVRTYAIGFRNSQGADYYNELPYAAQVAKQFGTDHREILVEPNVAELLPRLLWHMDEPIADAALITTYLVAEFARRDVTVILSGVGGDEIFGGYRRYLGESYGAYYNRLPRWLRQSVFLPLAKKLPSDRHSPLLNLARYARGFVVGNELPFDQRYRSYVEVFNRSNLERLLDQTPLSENDALDAAFAGSQDGDPLRRLFAVDLATQLPDDLLLLTDKMTMAASIECRVPLLDHKLVEMCAGMPSQYKIHGRRLKYVLKKALDGLLSDEIIHRKKRGFGAPMGAWLRHELAPILQSVLSKESIERRGLFRWQTVHEAIALHEASREDYTDHLLSLINLEIWCRIYLDGASHDDVTTQISEAVH